jgi:type II secretory pathway pseudopilin PulG
MAELIIVVAIICVIAGILLLVNWRKNVYRAHDAKRKADIVNINRAFEEYFNDKGCYPETTILDQCGDAALAPFLDKVPCDPTTKEPYKYVPAQETNLCLGNRLCAKLQDWSDPDITTLGCDAQNGCGWGSYWNYCLATGTSVIPSDFNPDVEPSPTPTPTPSLFGPYACRPGTQFGGVVIIPGVCNNVGDPTAFDCSYSFAESNCQNLCGSVSYWCPR